MSWPLELSSFKDQAKADFYIQEHRGVQLVIREGGTVRQKVDSWVRKKQTHPFLSTPAPVLVLSNAAELPFAVQTDDLFAFGLSFPAFYCSSFPFFLLLPLFFPLPFPPLSPSLLLLLCFAVLPLLFVLLLSSSFVFSSLPSLLHITFFLSYSYRWEALKCFAYYHIIFANFVAFGNLAGVNKLTLSAH